MLKPDLEYQPLLQRPHDLRRKGLSIFISLLVHAGIFLGVIFLFAPLKIHLYQDVHNVIIASPDEIFFPEYQEPVGVTEQPFGDVSDVQGQIQAGTSSSAQESARGERPLADRALNERDSEFLSRFELRPSRSEKLKLSSGYELEMSLQQEVRVPFTSQMRERESQPEPDVRGLVGSDLSGGKLSNYSGSQGPGGRSWLQTQMEQLKQEYDLTPWADEVVAIVLGNWTVPPSGQYTLIGRVEIVAVIQKDGRVSWAEIRASSQNSLIDQTALKALESSAPLPGLPEDFPQDQVQIQLVFALK